MQNAQEKIIEETCKPLFAEYAVQMLATYINEPHTPYLGVCSNAEKLKKQYKVRLDERSGIIYRYVDQEKDMSSLVDHQVIHFDQPNCKTLIPNGEYLYIVSPKGGFYVLRDEKPFELSVDQRHSTIRAGQDVLCAGRLIVKNGKIIKINNESGHYNPDEQHLHLSCIHLYYKGFLRANCKVSSYDDSKPITIQYLVATSPHLLIYEKLMTEKIYSVSDFVCYLINQEPNRRFLKMVPNGFMSRAICAVGNTSDIATFLAAIKVTDTNKKYPLQPKACRMALKIIDFYYTNVTKTVSLDDMQVENKRRMIRNLNTELSKFLEYGQVTSNSIVIKLARTLECDMERFVTSQQSYNEFKIIFLTRLHSHDDLLNQRSDWDKMLVFIANIVIALLTLCIAPIIQLAYSVYTTGEFSLFFTKTNTQRQVVHLDEELTKINAI